ncbi:hypothetical protein TIFTF001_013303 [Ficus carica]|uniref:Pentatricopeptide repeat-containing protein n=1 Tax=Ficus carica TaxID=3494 RepID=A0AA88AHM6_FICCA|nr:hypothetical protein TIFTF001_013303 [Ficus carica]
MAVKFTPLTFSRKIPIWVISNVYISSLSCANSAEIFAETNRNPPNSLEFEQSIRFLRNKLVPDNLIRVLDNTDDLGSAVEIFKWASLQNRFRHTPDTYHRIILKLGLAGNIQEMEGFCENMVRDRIPGTKEAFCALIDTFVEHSRLSEALLVLVNMNLGGFSPSIEIFNALLGALVKAKRDFKDVLLVYKEMVKAGVSPSVDTFNYLLEALFEFDRVETALDQFRRMEKKGCCPNGKTFEILVKGLISKHRVDEAIVVLHEIFESGCKPDLSFFSCTIPLFCREDKPKEGIRLFRMMRDLNFVPDLVIYTVLIECLCDNFWVDEAISLFEEMIKAGLPLPDNVVVYVVNMFCNVGKVDEAVKFLGDKQIIVTSPYNALLEGCYHAGKPSMAKDILGKMLESNIDDCRTWNIVIRWVCEQKGLRKASELLGRMVVSSFMPDSATYSALVIGNCKSSKYEDALKLFHQIQDECWVLDSVSYSELVEGLCSMGSVIEAAEVFRYTSNNGYPLRSSSFSLLVKGICDTGKLSEAIRVCRLAYRSGTLCTSSTYTAIMHGLLKEGKPKDVLILFSQMMVEGCSLDSEVNCVLIESMSLQNRIEDCVLLFNMMVKDGLVPDSERLFEILSCLANHHQLRAISGSIDKLISREEMKSSSYNVLINGLWKEGSKNEAHWLLDLMLEKGWVPDAKTHGLLIGSVAREDMESEMQIYGNTTGQDTVSNILVEGLENM